MRNILERVEERERAFEELQILDREKVRKRECREEIIKMKESAGLVMSPSNTSSQLLTGCPTWSRLRGADQWFDSEEA